MLHNDDKQIATNVGITVLVLVGIMTTLILLSNLIA